MAQNVQYYCFIVLLFYCFMYKYFLYINNIATTISLSRSPLTLYIKSFLYKKFYIAYGLISQDA